MSGDHSANGRFTTGNKSGVRKGKRAAGSDGVIVNGGYVHTGETSTLLQGRQKWVEYSNTFSFPPVAIAALLRYALISGAKWSLAENKSGSRDAIRGAEIVQDGLLDARLDSGDTWPEIAAKASMSYFNGSSLHASALGRRKDGTVVYTDIAHRPMDTIEQWHRDSTGKPFHSVTQRVVGDPFTIPLNESLYLVERMLGDNPFGVGVLRLCVERIKRAGDYEALEGSELFSSLGGLPIARVPLEEIYANAPKDPTARASYVSDRTTKIKEVVQNRIKTPNKQQWIELDSVTYQGSDPNSISSIPKWGIEVLKAELQGLVEARKVVTDLHLDVARVLHVEFVYVGGGDSAGTFGMHESKLSSFAKMTQASLNRIGTRATQQLARRLVAANGLDPDIACPTMVPEQITMQSVLDTVSMLEGMQRAGLHPHDPARNILREQRGLPPEPDEQSKELMAPRAVVPDEDEEDEEDDEEIDDDDEDQVDGDKADDVKDPKVDDEDAIEDKEPDDE